MAVQSLRTLPFARGLVLVLVQLYQSWSATASGKTLCTPRRIPDERLPRQLQFLIYHRLFADKHVHRYTVQHLPGLETRPARWARADCPQPRVARPERHCHVLQIHRDRRRWGRLFVLSSEVRLKRLPLPPMHGLPPSIRPQRWQRRLVPRPPPLLCTADAPRSIHGPPKPAGRFGPGRRVTLRQGVHAVDEW